MSQSSENTIVDSGSITTHVYMKRVAEPRFEVKKTRPNIQECFD